MRRSKEVNRKYNTRKRILGVSAIVLALLLIMLPQFGYARNTDTSVFAESVGSKIRSAFVSGGENHTDDLTAIEWNVLADGSERVVSADGQTNLIYIKPSDDYSKLYIYSPADVLYANPQSTFFICSNEINPKACENLASIDSEFISRLDTSNVISMHGMFYGLPQVQELDLSNFDTSAVEDMGCMFKECSNIKSLDLSNFVTTALSTVSYNNGTEKMFYGCSSLEYLDISNFVIPSGLNTDQMFDGCTNLNVIRTPKTTAKEITLPDTYYHLLSDGTYEESGGSRVEYTTIPSGLTESITLVKVNAVPTVTPSALITASASPSATPTATASTSATPTATASPSATPTVTPTPTPTPAPTQATGQGSLTIEDNRSSKTGNNQVAGTVSNLVGNLRLIIEDSAGTGLKNLIDMEEGMILVPYDIYLVDNYGNAYKNFGSCTITLPVPDSMDLTKGRLKVVAVRSSNVLENLSSSLVIKSNTNCTQFTTTHFSEFGLLYIPYTETTAMVTPTATPTPATTEAAATAAAKATAAAGGSSSKSGSSGSSSSSSSSSSGSSYKAVPVSQVSARYGGNAKDMPKTGDGDVYRILGAIILLLFGAIELVTSIPTVKKINKSENDKEC